MDILTEHYNLTTITKGQLNYILPDIILEDPLKLHYSRQAMRLEDSKQKHVLFYFIEDDKCTISQLQHPESWEDTYNNYVLPRITPPPKRPRLHSDDQEESSGTC